MLIQLSIRLEWELSLAKPNCIHNIEVDFENTAEHLHNRSHDNCKDFQSG